MAKSVAWTESRMIPSGRPMSAYVKMASGKIAKTMEIVPEVFADFDGKGNVVGVEFLGKIEELKLFELVVRQRRSR